jgi:hypothetical protein
MMTYPRVPLIPVVTVLDDGVYVTTPQQGWVVARYTTLTGMPVIVTQDADEGRTRIRSSGRHDCQWECLGCGGRSAGLDFEEVVRDAAERHARDCMPGDDACGCDDCSDRYHTDVAADLKAGRISAAEAAELHRLGC